MLNHLKNFVRRLLEIQTNNGLWYHQLLNKNSYEEISGIALILYAISKAIKMGFLSRKYIDNIEKGWQGLISKINLSGNINIYDTCRLFFRFFSDYIKES